jgi:hypothetical protein
MEQVQQMKQIYLSGKLGIGKFALVDDNMHEFLNQWKWHYGCGGYAIRNVYIKGSGRKHQKGFFVYMHRMVNKTPDGLVTDHINRDKLDNRRENLRTCTDIQNRYNRGKYSNNTSGVLGVTWDKARNKWQAQIRVKNKNIHLGRYVSLQGATLARRWGEKLYHGETIFR